MPEQRGVIDVSQVQVPLIIKDISDVLLRSAEITGIVTSTIASILRGAMIQGVREITLTIDGIHSEIEIITHEGNIIRKLMLLEVTTRLCDEALERAKKLNIVNDDFRKELEQKIEELFYREMANLK